MRTKKKLATFARTDDRDAVQCNNHKSISKGFIIQTKNELLFLSSDKSKELLNEKKKSLKEFQKLLTSWVHIMDFKS